MDGQHTHGHGGGNGPDLAILVVIATVALLVGPAVAGAIFSLIHMLVIALAILVVVVGVGAAGLLWWKLHTHKLAPPWKRDTVTTQRVTNELPNGGAYLAITEEQLRIAIERAVERSKRHDR